VVIELKIGKFEPEFVSKMNFYLNAVDEQLRRGDDRESVRIILCATPTRPWLERLDPEPEDDRSDRAFDRAASADAASLLASLIPPPTHPRGSRRAFPTQTGC